LARIPNPQQPSVDLPPLACGDVGMVVFSVSSWSNNDGETCLCLNLLDVVKLGHAELPFNGAEVCATYTPEELRVKCTLPERVDPDLESKAAPEDANGDLYLEL
jgi:hypothetical protein